MPELEIRLEDDLVTVDEVLCVAGVELDSDSDDPVTEVAVLGLIGEASSP